MSVKSAKNGGTTVISQAPPLFNTIISNRGEQGDPGGPPGPTEVSGDPLNMSSLGSDNLLFTQDAANDGSEYVRKGEGWLPVTDQAVQDTGIAANAADLASHEADIANPHAVTADQVGGAPAVHTHVEADITDLDKYTQAQVDSKDAAVQDNLDTHEADVANPHSVTLGQVGGAPEVHTHVEVDITDLDKYDQALVDSKDAAVQANLNNHTLNRSNPHVVTQVQVGLGNVDNTSDAAKPVSTAQQTALDFKEDLVNKGVALGYAPLGADGRVPPEYAASSTTLIGGWNADTNSPDLTVVSPSDGNYWIVTVPGSTDLNGITVWNEGDWAIWSTSEPGNWIRVPQGSTVSSVFGRTGAVVAVKADYETYFVDVAGDTMTGNLILTAGADVQLDQGSAIRATEVGGLVRTVLAKNASDELDVGNGINPTTLWGSKLTLMGNTLIGAGSALTLDSDPKLPFEAVTMQYADAIKASSDAHIATVTGNPHNVLLSDVGGAPAVHTHVEADVTNLDKYTQAQVDSKDAGIQTNLDTHTSDATIHFAEAAIDHDRIQNIGSYTHAQIDGHINNFNDPHATNPVKGPVSSLDQNVVVFDGTTGRLIKGATGVWAGIGIVWVQSQGVSNAADIEFHDSLGARQSLFSYSELTGNSQVNSLNADLNLVAASGSVTVDKDPTVDLGVAPKQYVDNRMRWAGAYVSGNTYQKNDIVNDAGWAMVANKQTTDNAAPQPVGAAQWLLPDAPAWNSSSYQGQIVSGTRISALTRDFKVLKYRVWIDEITSGQEYRIVVRDNLTGEIATPASFLGTSRTTPGWLEVTVTKSFYLQTSDDYNFLVVSKTLGGTTISTLPLVYIDRDRDGPAANPGDGNFTYNRDNYDVRLAKLDSNGVDQTAIYDTVINGTTIRVTDDAIPTQWLEYEVINGFAIYANHYTFFTVLVGEGPDGRPDTDAQSTIKVVVPVPQAKGYVELPNGLSTYASASGKLTLATEVENQNGYAMDLYIQEYESSPDWDLVSFSE